MTEIIAEASRITGLGPEVSGKITFRLRPGRGTRHAEETGGRGCQSFMTMVVTGTPNRRSA